MRLKGSLRLAMRVEQRKVEALRRQEASQRMRATEEMRTMGRQRVVRRKKERVLLLRLLERRWQSEEMTARVRVKSRGLPRQRWLSSVLTQDVRAKTWRVGMRKRHRGPCGA